MKFILVALLLVICSCGTMNTPYDNKKVDTSSVQEVKNPLDEEKYYTIINIYSNNLAVIEHIFELDGIRKVWRYNMKGDNIQSLFFNTYFFPPTNTIVIYRSDY